MKSKIAILWLRNDLRKADNLALHHAAQFGKVLPVFTIDARVKKMGKNRLHFMYQSLQSLDTNMEKSIQIFDQSFDELLPVLIKKYQGYQIELFLNRVYEPQELVFDEKLATLSKELGIPCNIFQGNLLWNPSDIKKSDGTLYKVFTPFFIHGCLASEAPRKPLSAPDRIDYVQELVQKKDKYDVFTLLPFFNEKSDVLQTWDATEKGALNLLHRFTQSKLQGYAHDRDFPFMQGISCMSPYLASGIISPQQIWHAVTHFAKEHQTSKEDIQTYIKELCWREFCYSILYGFPQLDTKNYRSNFDAFAWQHDTHFLHAWQQGKTGYPLVDAGMRELLTTGFMHNRVRMVVASFLVKNLLIDWRYGKDWFWQQLVDADLANNSANWQWVAGCGADAAPYFRIFNPTLQAQKFDPDGLYIKKYVPELRLLSAKFIHEPWKASTSMLAQVKIKLGENYPLPIVDTKVSAQKALALYKRL